MQACTIVARNYLPQARVLARSFREHHPGVPFTVLIIDDPAPAASAEEFAVLWLSDIGLEPGEAERMALMYDVTEFATAVKPWLLRRLLRSGPDVVLYFDPDIEIFALVVDLAELARAHSIVLTPHVLEPFPRDGLQPSESTIMGAGNLQSRVHRHRAELCDAFPRLVGGTRLRRDAIIDPPKYALHRSAMDRLRAGAVRAPHSPRPACNVAYLESQPAEAVMERSRL